MSGTDAATTTPPIAQDPNAAPWCAVPAATAKPLQPDQPTSREWRVWARDAHDTASRITHDSDLAADIAQEALVRLVRCYRHVRNLHSWLYVVLGRLAATTQGREFRKASDPRRSHRAIARTSPDQALDLERGLQALPARQARLLALTLEGYSHAEIAERIGCAIHQVGPQVARAQRALGRWWGSRPARPAAATPPPGPPEERHAWLAASQSRR
jgi:RNA polymerase sigma factor (sigma-70 family)